MRVTVPPKPLPLAFGSGKAQLAVSRPFFEISEMSGLSLSILEEWRGEGCFCVDVIDGEIEV